MPGGSACGSDTTTTLNLVINYNTTSTTTVTQAGSYTWPVNGVTYTQTGVYTKTSLNAAGCLHTSILHLTIPAPLSMSLVENQPISCFGNNDGAAIATGVGDPPITYRIDGGPFNNTTGYFFNITPGTHTICAKDVNGAIVCDTISFIEPAALDMTFYTDSMVSCQGHDGALTLCISGGTNQLQGYLTWWYQGPVTINWPQNGYTMNDLLTNNFATQFQGLDAGLYTVKTEDDRGCFYTETFNLLAAPPVTVTAIVPPILCNGSSTTITPVGAGGVMYLPESNPGPSGDPNYCLPPQTPTVSTLTYQINGAPVQAAYGVGTYTLTATDYKGCSASTVISITQPSALGSSINATACNSYTWGLNSATYTASGIYTHTLTSSTNCDSVVTLNLTIHYDSNDGSATVTACDSYTWNGTTYTASGVYTYTSLNAAGCVNTATLTLTINHSSNNGDATVTACDSYTWNGTTYTATGVYTYTSLNAVGCVNTATLTLTINHSSNNGDATVTACDSYTWNGTTYTMSGVYTYTSLNAAGCVNTATLTLTINHSSNNGDATVTACDSYTWNGTTYAATGVYTYTSLNAVGCVNTATLTLTINHSSNNGDATVTACDSYIWNGSTYTESGIYTFTSLNNEGCVNTAVLTLTINYSTNDGGANIAECESFSWYGTTYTTSGVYTYTSINAAGCLNTAVLTLTIYPATASFDTVTACGQYVWNGTTYTQSGVYTYTSFNANFCVHTATLVLTIHPITSTTTTITATGVYTWPVNGITYTASGTYSHTSLNAQGCPHTDILILIIQTSLDINVTIDQEISCYGNNDGAALVSGIGTPPFIYNIDGGLFNNTTGIFTGITPGAHVFCVKDNYGNTACSAPVMFVEPDPLAMTFTVDSVASCYNNDGALSVNITGGTNLLQGYLTWWTNANGDTLNDILTNNFATNLTGLPAGTYNVAIEDDRGCFFDADGVVPPSTISVTATNTPIICFGETSVITPLGSGGVPYAPLTYLINGAPVASSYPAGTYTITAIDAKGCSATTVLTVNGPSGPLSSTVNATACDSYTWTLNNTTYTASGNYTHTVSGSNNCDSVITLHLDLYNSTHDGDANVTACDSYTWNGSTYTSSGIYTYTSMNASGCLNTATLTLNINYNTTDPNIILSSCDFYTWNATTYTASGTYTYTSLNNQGCVNTSTLILTINQSTNDGDATITACDSYTWNGTTYTASGIYTYTSINVKGCLNTATLTLTIHNSTTDGDATITACGSYTWNGTTYTSSGTYTYTSTNVFGCLNTATLYLTIYYNTFNGDQTASACNSYTWNGVTYTASGVYTYTSMNASGCLNTATLTLTIYPNTNNGDQVITACDSYTWNGITYTASGIYTHTSINSNGCLNTATLTLTINYATYDTSYVTTCNSYLWLACGQVYTASGVYTITCQSMPSGCPKVCTMYLTIHHDSSFTNSVTACTSYLWPKNGGTYFSSGVYTNISFNANGCLNFDTLILTINNPTNSTTTITACDSYTWNGTTYTASGIYTKTSVNAAGCLHTATLILTINHSSTNGSMSQTACNAYTWPATGITYTTSGVYTHTTLNAAGCINTATLNLTINYNSTTGSNAVTACDSYTWPVTGLTYTSSGVYTKTSINAVGCLNTATLTLTITKNPTDGGTIGYNESGCAPGYDPANIVNLTLPSGGSGGTLEYVWLMSIDGGITSILIPGATNASYDPGPITQTTWYRRCARTAGCISYSAETSWIIKSVSPVPVVTISRNPNKPTVCPLTTVTLTAAGATTYVWNTGATSASITVSPAVTTTYTVTGTTNGCSSTATITITVGDCTDSICWQSPTLSYVGATTKWSISGNSVTIRTTFTKGFVDNTYGTNIIGWPGSHSFGNLTGSDKLQLALYDTANVKKMEFTVDYFSSSSAVPSGYDCLGVTGGEGGMLLGSASDVTAATTSLDQNFNTFGYVLTTNSPATNASYTPNPTYPNWIYDVWYEVTVNLSAFGAAGFGYPDIASVHASPSKTGNNTEVVDPVPCPCNNYVTNAGTIGSDETACGTSFNPANIVNLTSPTGGSGALEYQWYQSTNSGSTSTLIAGATNASYDPPVITQTTWYRRFARRAGCSNFDSSSNWVKKILGSNTTTTTLNATACNSYVWAANGVTYTTSGTYTHTSINASGCVNTATLVLTVNYSSTTGSMSATACNSYTWSATGLTYTASGVYTKTTTNAGGCVNTATLTLTINNSSTTGSMSATSCGPYTWALNGQTYTTSGAYTHTTLNASGCVNTATLTLTVTTPAVVVTANPNGVYVCAGTVINLTASGATSYLWSNGATTASIVVTPSVTTTYTVTGTSNGCPDTETITVTVGNCDSICWQSPTKSFVGATTKWAISGNSVIIRTKFTKEFVDNTYGTNIIGWPGSHSFGNLTGSDKLQLALFDNANVKKMEFTIDYFSSSAAAPSGYDCLGVTGGEGGMLLGSASDVTAATTSLDQNFNTFGYVLTTNSPATDTLYTPNPTYPNWIYDVWYEVTVNLSAFGAAGFGHPDIASVHASPSKTGNNTEVVDPVPCPCNNYVTNAGTIGSDETACGTSFNPANIVNLTSPTGGSGPLEYQWYQSTNSGSTSTLIAGATNASYDPPVITQTTWYRRFARRAGCSDFDSSSNWVKKILGTNTTTATLNATACNSYTWAANGQTYTTSGTYTKTTINASGCVNTATLVLTVNYNTTSTQSATACDSYTWPVTGLTYTVSGTYTKTSTMASGCVLTNILNLTINNSSSSTTSATACNSYTWALNGVTYTASGSYTNTSTNASGCNHISTLNLTINYSTTTGTVTITSDKSTLIYQGASSKNYGSCSVIEVEPDANYEVKSLIDFNLSAIPSGATITGATLRLVHGSSSFGEGGDPFTTDVKRLTRSWVEGTACDASQAGSATWASSGPVNWTTAGGDAAATVYGSFVGGAGDPVGTVYIANVLNLVNEWYTGASINYGLMLDPGADPNGGDEWYDLWSDDATNVSDRPQLIINYTIPSTASTTSITACGSYTWSVNGVTYTTSGTYTATSQNASGCVHTATLNLTINSPSTTGSLSATACNSYTWVATGQTYTSSGIYTKTSTNAAGCVNTATLTLTINNSTTTGSMSATACGSYTWAATGLTYTASGVYTKTTLNASGCVNTATLTLTVTTPTTVVVTANPNAGAVCPGTVVTLSASGASSYVWNTGATAATIVVTPSVTTTYTVTGTTNGCTDVETITVTVGNCDSLCWRSPTYSYVGAKTTWSVSGNSVTIRTTFTKEFVDNTYGTNKIGWPGSHSFSDLTGSDRLQLALYDAANVKKMEFKIDYLTSSAAAPSGYKSLGVTGGDGGMLVGSATDVTNAVTSLDYNFNTLGYVLTSNSPATNASYAPNPTYPHWIYDVWYEVTVNLSAFGAAGFGYPSIASVHASPSKTGNNTEVVNQVSCVDTPANGTARVNASSQNGLQNGNKGNDLISAVSIYPNPVSGIEQEINLQYNLKVSGKVNIAVYSMDGRLLSNQSFDGVEGDNRNVVGLPALADGTYNLIVLFGNEKQTHKFVVH